MRPFVFVFFYVTDELLSLLTPLASGLFAVFVVAWCLMHPATSRAAPPSTRILWTFSALLVMGTVGAVLSGTRVSPLFVGTVILLYALWWSGARLPPVTRLVTPGAALFGVLLATAFVVPAVWGYDLFSAARGVPANRVAGLFLEPSHLAIYVMPLWLIAFQQRSYRPVLLICLVILAPSQFTFSMAAILLIFFGLRALLVSPSLTHTLASFSKLGLVLALAAWVVYLVPDLFVLDGIPLATYLASRLFGFGALPGDDNFSVSPLVILQGFELAAMSIDASRGLGVGLGNLGTNEAIYGLSASRAIIVSVTAGGIDLNLRDGGILLNKLAGEIGIMIILLAGVVANGFGKIRAMPASRSRDMHVIIMSILFTVLFVRALPYFAAPTCLAILTLASLVHGGAKIGRRRRRVRRQVDTAGAATPLTSST